MINIYFRRQSCTCSESNAFGSVLIFNDIRISEEKKKERKEKGVLRLSFSPSVCVYLVSPSLLRLFLSLSFSFSLSIFLILFCLSFSPPPPQPHLPVSVSSEIVLVLLTLSVISSVPLLSSSLAFMCELTLSFSEMGQIKYSISCILYLLTSLCLIPGSERGWECHCH